MSDAFEVRFDGSEGGCRWELVEVATGRLVGCDGGEPEDQLLVRDWKWVPVELNALAAKLTQVSTERDALAARLSGRCSDTVDELRDALARAIEERDAARREMDEAKAEVGEWKAEIIRVRPKADCYDRICAAFGIESNVLGYVQAKLYALAAYAVKLKEALDKIQQWVKSSVARSAEFATAQEDRFGKDSTKARDAAAELHGRVNMGLNIRGWCERALSEPNPDVAALAEELKAYREWAAARVAANSYRPLNAASTGRDEEWSRRFNAVSVAEEVALAAFAAHEKG